MDRVKELHVGARTADALVYVVGIAGVAGGGLLLRTERPAYAVIAWALTFCAGAALRLLASMSRAVAEILSRTRDAGERRLGDAGGPADPHGGAADPGNWGRLH